LTIAGHRHNLPFGARKRDPPQPQDCGGVAGQEEISGITADATQNQRYRITNSESS
jgi:hypothetical protein